MAVAHPRGDGAGAEEAGRLVDERREQRPHQRDLRPLAESAALALRQRREDRDGREQAGDHVDQRDADLRRRPVGLTGDAHQPADRLDQQVVAW